MGYPVLPQADNGYYVPAAPPVNPAFIDESEIPKPRLPEDRTSVCTSEDETNSHSHFRKALEISGAVWSFMRPSGLSAIGASKSEQELRKLVSEQAKKISNLEKKTEFEAQQASNASVWYHRMQQERDEKKRESETLLAKLEKKRGKIAELKRERDSLLTDKGAMPVALENRATKAAQRRATIAEKQAAVLGNLHREAQQELLETRRVNDTLTKKLTRVVGDLLETQEALVAEQKKNKADEKEKNKHLRGLAATIGAHTKVVSETNRLRAHIGKLTDLLRKTTSKSDRDQIPELMQDGDGEIPSAPEDDGE